MEVLTQVLVEGCGGAGGKEAGDDGGGEFHLWN